MRISFINAKKAKNAKNAKALRLGTSYKIAMTCLVARKKKAADGRNSDLGTQPPRTPREGWFPLSCP